MNQMIATATTADIADLELLSTSLKTRISDLKKQRTQERRDADKADATKTREERIPSVNRSLRRRAADEREPTSKKASKEASEAQEGSHCGKKISQNLVLAPTQKGIFQTFRKTHKNAKTRSPRL